MDEEKPPQDYICFACVHPRALRKSAKYKVRMYKSDHIRLQCLLLYDDVPWQTLCLCLFPFPVGSHVVWKWEAAVPPRGAPLSPRLSCPPLSPSGSGAVETERHPSLSEAAPQPGQVCACVCTCVCGMCTCVHVCMCGVCVCVCVCVCGVCVCVCVCVCM